VHDSLEHERGGLTYFRFVCQKLAPLQVES
jgi:hypothetical protein